MIIGEIISDMFTCTTNSPEETAHLAELVGQKIREGTVLGLEGDLAPARHSLSRALRIRWGSRAK